MIAAVIVLGTLTLLLVVLFVGMTLGYASKRINALAFTGLALLAGSIMWLSSLILSSDLSYLPFFQNLVSFVAQIRPSSSISANAVLVAVLVSVAILEIGLVSGYVAGRKTQYTKISAEIPIIRKATPLPPKIAPTIPARKAVPASESAVPAAGGIVMPQLSGTRVERSYDRSVQNSPLSADEKTLAELFIFERVTEVVPRIDKTKQGGFYYEELTSLGWNTAREELALNSLARRGYLIASPKEKVLHCRDCGSANLEFRSECPDCGSIRLSKDKVLEHFACGMVEREQLFRQANGDLVCPKCNRKLELIGSDYRSLGFMYVCQNCLALNTEPRPKLKCASCGLKISPEAETEEFLFSYILNPEMAPQLKEIVKPVERLVSHFKSLGHTVFAPAFVRGRSGTEHEFDLLVLGKLSILGSKPSSKDSTKTVVELLVKDGPVELEEITRVYGKISDVDYESIVYASPLLAANARSYAEAYHIRVFEGKTIEEAIRNSESGPVHASYNAQSSSTIASSK